MKSHVSVITLGVNDLDRAKAFYSALGWPTYQDYPGWVAFSLNDGSVGLGVIERTGLAADAGAEFSGNGAITLSYLVRDEDRVAGVLAEAEEAGATIVKPAEKSEWGGTSGVFADPDGYHWKVAAGQGDQPFAE